MIKIIIIGILILILIVGCIESDYDKTENKTVNETLNKSNISEISNESNESGSENKNDKPGIDLINESEVTNKSKINNSINNSAVENIIENVTENITDTSSLNKSSFTSKPQAKRIKFDIYGMGRDNIDAQELESRLQIDVKGIIYVRISGADKNGEIIYDASKITRYQVVKEAGFIKMPSGTIVRDFHITVTEETNCTQSNNEYRCCIGRQCKIYGQ